MEQRLSHPVIIKKNAPASVKFSVNLPALRTEFFLCLHWSSTFKTIICCDRMQFTLTCPAYKSAFFNKDLMADRTAPRVQNIQDFFQARPFSPMKRSHSVIVLSHGSADPVSCISAVVSHFGSFPGMFPRCRRQLHTYAPW